MKYISDDTIPDDVVDAQQSWKVCHYQTLKLTPTALATSTDQVQFIKSQPEYISQYYANIKWEIPKVEVYQVLKETKKILMATDIGEKAFKGSL